METIKTVLSLFALTLIISIPFVIGGAIAGTVSGDGGYSHQEHTLRWERNANAVSNLLK